MVVKSVVTDGAEQFWRWPQFRWWLGWLVWRIRLKPMRFLFTSLGQCSCCFCWCYIVESARMLTLYWKGQMHMLANLTKVGVNTRPLVQEISLLAISYFWWCWCYIAYPNLHFWTTISRYVHLPWNATYLSYYFYKSKWFTWCIYVIQLSPFHLCC